MLKTLQKSVIYLKKLAFAEVYNWVSSYQVTLLSYFVLKQFEDKNF